MLQINNLDKSYGQQVIFENTGFTLNPGERLGLVGRNGHGKSTLFKMILGREQADSGTIYLPNGYRTGHLSQHIEFTEDTILKEACMGLSAKEDGAEESYKAEIILMGLGFSTDDFNLAPETLSGGFQVRLNLAKVLVSDPNLLLLDEPTNYLDILSMRWLGGFLRSWKKELILITHDREFMDSVTTHTMAIHRCRLRKEPGPTEKIYRQLLLEEEIYEKTRINDEKKRNEVEQFINRFRAKATKAKAVQSRINALQKKERLEKLSETKDLEFAFNPAPFTGKQLMEVSGLSFGFTPDSPLLIQKLNFFVGKNDRIAIIGKNGKGKTTLLNLLAGELSPSEGTVRGHRDLKLAYFGQTNINRLDPHKSVEEEIMDVHPINNRGAARKICGAMMFPDDQALKKVSVLSGGEKSRVLLGKLLVSPSNLLLLDEPTNHLDMESTDSLIEAVDAFNGAAIIVSHSEMVLHALATRLIVFDNNRVTLFEGTYSDFLSRVGWESENSTNPAGNGIKKPAAGAQDKKQLRRVKAELINAKSKTLRKIQGRIDSTENEIMSLEAQTEQDNKDIMEASISGHSETIKKLSKTIHESKARIDVLFSELETLHCELDIRTKEFDEKLSNIETI